MKTSTYTIGLLCIVGVALLWSASSVLVQDIYESGFKRPVFITWVANSLFIMCLPVRYASSLLQRLAVRHGFARTADNPTSAMLPAAEGRSEEAGSTGGGEHNASGGGGGYAAGDDDDSASAAAHEREQMMRSARAGMFIAPVWFAANCSYNIGMSLTSITSSTVISTSSAAFTLFLSVVWLREQPTALKLVGVGLCWLGNGLTVVGDDGGAEGGSNNLSSSGGGHGGLDAQQEPASSPSPTSIFWGDLLCVAGAALYATYTVGIRRLAPPELSVFFGFLGLTTCALFAPLVLALALTGVEPLGQLTWGFFGLILLKGLLDNVLSEYLWVTAVLLTSPAVATVGLSLTVPLAILSDLVLPPEWLVAPSAPTALSLLAACAVVAGFVAITCASKDDEQASGHHSQGEAEGGAEADAPAASSREWCPGMHDPLLGQGSSYGTSQHGARRAQPEQPLAPVAAAVVPG